MPIDCYVDEERRAVVATVVGDFTMGEILEAIRRSVRDPGFERGFSVLSDHTAVGEPLTTPQAKQMVSYLESLSESLGGSRWAVVAPQAASYGMLRMVSVLAERIPMEVGVFASHEEAHEWLAAPDALTS